MLSIWFVFLRSHSISSSANKMFPLERSKRVLCSGITCRIVHKWGLLPSRTFLACHKHPCCYPLLINFHLIGFDSVIFPTVEHPCRILLALHTGENSTDAPLLLRYLPESGECVYGYRRRKGTRAENMKNHLSRYTHGPGPGPHKMLAIFGFSTLLNCALSLEIQSRLHLCLQPQPRLDNICL